jgi:hypothetical protein
MDNGTTGVAEVLGEDMGLLRIHLGELLLYGARMASAADIGPSYPLQMSPPPFWAPYMRSLLSCSLQSMCSSLK